MQASLYDLLVMVFGWIIGSMRQLDDQTVLGWAVGLGVDAQCQRKPSTCPTCDGLGCSSWEAFS
jgi:hypothetical protein